ncbi:MAG: tetratricopeptide repeat protein [Bacteroidales bacterium]|nr:tetratricopeptide repeat protein [Bacteroidales bacterium]
MSPSKINIIQLLLFCFFLTSASQTTFSKNSPQTQEAKDSSEITKHKDLLNQILALSSKSPQEAKQLSLEALALARKIGDSNLVGRTYTRISTIYYHELDYINSIESLEHALQLFTIANDTIRMGITHSRIGANYVKLSNYPKAVNHLIEALNATRKAGYSRGESSAALNLGVVFHRNNQNDKSIFYYDYAFKIFVEDKDTTGILNCYNNLGIIYREQKEYDKALDHYNMSLNLSTAKKDTSYMLNTISNIGSVYHYKKEYSKAIKYFEKAISYGPSVTGKDVYALNYQNMGSTYKELKEYKKAIEYLLIAAELFQQIEKKEKLSECYFELSTCYNSIGDYSHAYNYHVLYSELDKEIFNLKNLTQIQNREIGYQLELSIEERERLKQLNQIQNLQLERSQIYLFSLGFGIFLVIIITILFFQRQRLLSMKRTTELESKLFRSQMNPHFIFNSLSAIQSFVYAHEPREAAKYLSSFAKLTRSILTNSIKDYITLEDEVETLEHYLKLQQLRFDNRFEYHIEIDDEIETSLFEIPPMLIQPFIENSIEHGFSNGIEKNGKLFLNYKLNDNNIEVELSDNGIGYKKSQANKKISKSSHQSYAISIIEERLRILSPTFIRKKQILITDLSDIDPLTHGTKINLKLPFRMR